MDLQVTPISQTALENDAVLQVIARLQDEPGADLSSKALATLTGRNPSNMSRTLDRMVEAGLIFRDPKPELSSDGREALEALNRARNAALSADGVAEGGVSTGVHAEFDRNPDQPRKKFNPDKLEQLADTIEAVGVLEPILVWPPNDAGLKIIWAGERRWRACGIVNQRHDDPNRVRIPYVTRAPSEEEKAALIAEAAELALIENGQGEDLTSFEKAKALRSMVPSRYPSARAAAKVIGVHEKTAQDWLRALAELPPAVLKRWEDDELGWREVRDILRPAPVKAAEADPAQIDIEEVTGTGQAAQQVPAALLSDRARDETIEAKAKADLAARAPDRAARMDALMANLPEGADRLSVELSAAIGLFNLGVLTSDFDQVDKARDLYTAIVWKMNGGSHFGCEMDAGPTLRRATAAPDGEAPAWGQAGKFLLRVDGMLAAVTIRGGVDVMGLSIAFNAVELDKPFFSETGYRGDNFAAQDMPSLDGADVVTEVARIMRSLIAREKKPALIPERHLDGAMRFLKGASWVDVELDSKGVFDGDQRIAKHVATNGSRRDAPAPAGRSGPDLNRAERIALIEATHKAVTQNVATTGRAARIGAYWLDAGCSRLKDEGLLTFVQAGGELGWCVMWGEKAYAWFKANLPEVFAADGELSISEGQLALAQAEAATMEWTGPTWTGPGYVTPWLNVADTEGSGEAFLADGAEGEEVLTAEQIDREIDVVGDPSEVDESLDEEALDVLLGELRNALYVTQSHTEDRWHHAEVSMADLAFKAVWAVRNGVVLDALIALMGMLAREGEGDANEALRAYSQTKTFVEEEPYYALGNTAAEAVPLLKVMVQAQRGFRILPLDTDATEKTATALEKAVAALGFTS